MFSSSMDIQHLEVFPRLSEYLVALLVLDSYWSVFQTLHLWLLLPVSRLKRFSSTEVHSVSQLPQIDRPHFKQIIDLSFLKRVQTFFSHVFVKWGVLPVESNICFLYSIQIFYLVCFYFVNSMKKSFQFSIANHLWYLTNFNFVDFRRKMSS